MADIEDLRDLALSLPLTIEEADKGWPAFRVEGRHKFAICREEGVLLKLDFEHQEWLFETRADTFSRVVVARYDWALAKLEALDREELSRLVIMAWSREAPKKVVAQFVPD
ncbi:MAG: hypothetical protein JWP35_4313 [Caulobacter sp.]|nr:hypothetical protein [Caulobacter sp.]